MRTETCVCSGSITAPSLEVAAPYVEAHGRTSMHQLWRAQRTIRETSMDAARLSELLSSDLAREQVHSRPPSYRHPRPHRSTVGTASRDVSGTTASTSTDGVEGAA